jgi:glycosyltransferase involved in cell wall biosynthesis
MFIAKCSENVSFYDYAMRISIIITNYNYANYVLEAIESVLSQVVEGDELIVVDDGSTDGSLELLSPLATSDGFALIAKENGGQASAFNAGFAAATRDLIWLLDADDFLLPGALDRVRRYWDPASIKLHAPMQIVDKDSKLLSLTNPKRFSRMASGNIRFSYLLLGAYSSPPTSGAVYLRSALETIFPVPEAIYRICADAYLKERSALMGAVLKLPEPLAAYRIHGENNFAGATKLSPERAKAAVARLLGKYQFLLKHDRSVVTTFTRSIAFIIRGHAKFLNEHAGDEASSTYCQLFPLWTSRVLWRLCMR